MADLSIRVGLADDHPMVALGISSELSRSHDLSVEGHCSNSTDLMEMLNDRSIDVLVADYSMPGGKYGDGLVLISYLRRHYPRLKIVIYTMVNGSALVWAIVKQGVNCIVNKRDSTEHLTQAVFAAHRGTQYYSPTIKDSLLINFLAKDRERLTPRESEIVRLFCSGTTISEIADILHRSVQTVSSQKRSAMKKLGVASDVDLFKTVLQGDAFDASFL
ncbi:response regulator [Achromobacter seleniivolatilans]|uniref:Response regulator n=1 Tax=Achromobacter seleniivolatilans TaxID=3047478 RepID=A0ABY9LWC9_9BURK|nr:response regulator [Achromobacter sp. R39]WMD19076.1 response regulator [Achromobacter sp. R39]